MAQIGVTEKQVAIAMGLERSAITRYLTGIRFMWADCLDCGEIQFRIIHEDMLVYCRSCGSACLSWRPA